MTSGSVNNKLLSLRHENIFFNRLPEIVFGITNGCVAHVSGFDINITFDFVMNY